ncbi:hypothetical protein DWX58_00795 [Pseudoflavonifractor sp. AF19-9AC]|nr:hypothetical protein DWX58_00795 [Pseudoflavonifractor sp. AF19-9AC]
MHSFLCFVCCLIIFDHASATDRQIIDLRKRFSLDNLKLDDNMLNIPLFMADRTDQLIGMR